VLKETQVTDDVDGESEFQYIRFEIVRSIATITLNRPSALNSLSPALLDEFIEVLHRIADDQKVKVLVLAGEGRAFCTGADLKEVIRLFDDWPSYVQFLYRLTEVGVLLENLPFPTIARIHGYALAGGLELLLCCDMAIAADDAKIGDQHSNVGLIAGAGGIPRLTRRIGQQAALELLYTGAWLSGAEAAEQGIVLRSVPSDALDAEIDKLTSVLTQKSRTASSYLKRVVHRSTDLPLQTTLDEERSALLEYFSTSPHPREGISAFLEKRKPVFE
jgi:enoyl-CoA hydratase/carnithine racemase